MIRQLGRNPRKLARLGVAAVLLGGLGACQGGVLDVNDPDVLTPEGVTGPNSIPLIIAATVGTFQNVWDEYVLYSGLFTDEFILAGTFPTRKQVDDREIIVDNGSLTGDVYEPLHAARFTADDAVRAMGEIASDPGADPALVAQGTTLGQYYGAYERLLLSELYCQSILGGNEGEPAPLLPDARMQEALSLFQAAEASATAAGMSDVANAARVGQARANLWLRNFSQAASLAASVPSGFTFVSEYSSNDPSQYDEVYTFTYGDTQVIRWTVGDGNLASRDNEKFAYFDEFVNLGLIVPNPGGFSSFDSSIPVMLQCLYGGCNSPPTALGQASNIIIASGYEADLIEAEVAVRNGDIAGAAAIVDPILAGANPTGSVFTPANFTGVLANDLVEIARARASALWLTGERVGTFRRFLVDGIDMFPVRSGRGDTAFPIVRQELDNNVNVSQACPTGPPFK
ncbi:MAG: hypothetical protein ACE5HQ_00235 [Gemmatimonadota bacterium]